MLARSCKYLRTHHIGLIALFVALGGTSYAAITLPANSVGNKQLKTGAVTLKKIERSTRRKLEGDEGPTGATGPQGPAGARGAMGPRGPQGPGAIRLDWSSSAPNDGAPTQTLYSSLGLSVTASCVDGNTVEPGLIYPRVRVLLGATGTGATANVTWTREGDNQAATSTFQDGVANGAVTVESPLADVRNRIEGHAILENSSRAAAVVFHAFSDDNANSCKVDAVLTPTS